MSSSQNNEGQIRAAMVEADVVEVMVALPGQLFFNTPIPACLWFLVKQKQTRKGEVLFIDARKLGFMKNRVNREFSDDDVQKIAQTVHLWREDQDRAEVPEGEDAPVYADIPGFCKSATLEEIQAHGCVLSPGRYTGSEEVDDDDDAFKERLDEIVGELKGLFGRSDALRVEVKKGMKELGYEL